MGYPLKSSLLLEFSFEALKTAGKSVFFSLWVGGAAAGVVTAIIGYVITLQIIRGGKKRAKLLRGRLMAKKPVPD